MPIRLTPHLLTELAGLSEDLPGVSEDSLGFADKGVSGNPYIHSSYIITYNGNSLLEIC